MSFRPLAGIMVLIDEKKKMIEEKREMVSVPLRGLWFLSRIIDDVNDYDEFMEFPSPCGDYGSYQRNDDEYKAV